MVGITGASGFVGQNLVKYLSEFGISQLAISRQELESNDFNKINSADSLVHLAGKAHDLKSTSNLDYYLKVNFELTKRIYDAFLKSSCTKFIFISSVKAVADHLDTVLTEELVPNPKTPYGVSKLMAEKYIQGQPLPEGKSYYILRPCMIHGPGNKGNFNLLYKFISKDFPYPLAAFNNKRSFLSIENFCFVIKNIVERTEIGSGIYNIADNESISTNELIELIAQSFGRKARLWRINTKLIKSIATIGNNLPLLINTERLNKLTENYTVDNAKLREFLNTPLPVSNVEGIKRTIFSFL